jgi:hypothetical protein
VVVILWGADSLPPAFASRQLHIRAALLVVALGLCFVYDDPAAETTDPAPSPLRKRRAVRAVLGVGPWGVLIAATLLVVGQGMEPTFILSDEVPNPLPIGRILLEASAMAAWGLAIASVISKRWDEEPGRFASAGLLVLYAVSWAIPEAWKPWANPTDQRWETALPWWWATFAIGVLIVIAFSWDTRVGWRLRSRRKESEGFASPETVDTSKSTSGQ